MPSRSPEVRLEVLESRFAPARLVPGPQISEFGADLTALASIDGTNLIDPVSGGAADILDSGSDAAAGGYQLAAGVVKVSAGTLVINSSAILNYQGITIDPALVNYGSISLLTAPVQVLQPPSLDTSYTAQLTSGSVLNLNTGGTLYAGTLSGGTLVMNSSSYFGSYSSAGSVSFSSATLFVSNGGTLNLSPTLSLRSLWIGVTALTAPAEFVNVDGPAPADDAVTVAPVPLTLGSV